MSSETVLLNAALILVLGASAQWAAWKFHIPSILILLITGIIAGPVTGLIHPAKLMGNLLFPFVSSSVAIILFEGGLSLKFAELKNSIGIVLRIVSVGMIVTWGISVWAAHVLGGLPLSLSFLTGAILVVTGPTVIAPLLRQVRLKGDVGPILKWESILIDPIGAIFALLTFQVIFDQDVHLPQIYILRAILMTLAVGICVGFIAGYIMVVLIGNYWLPDFLQNPIALTMVVVAFALSNHIQDQSGLLTVTVMGIAMANQKRADMRSIAAFKETLTTLLLSTLFIILAARLELAELESHIFQNLLVILVLLLAARPLSIFLSTWSSHLSKQEKLYLMLMAPRGIVAASVSSIFVLRLIQAGYPEGGRLLSLVV